MLVEGPHEQGLVIGAVVAQTYDRIRDGVSAYGNVQSVIPSEPGSPFVSMSEQKIRIGVLMIGSLYWSDLPHRKQWRRDRLDVTAKQYVSVPIRYGRRSSGWGCSFTMVFSTELGQDQLGRGILVPCRSVDLFEEATALWAAESAKGENPKKRISGGWGCVALLENPEHPIPKALRERWTQRVSTEPCHGKLNSAVGEEVAVDDNGFLNISWPTTQKDVEPSVNVILATATNPTIVEGRYPPVENIAAAWRVGKGKADGRYFRNNQRNGIETFQDEKIEELLGKGGTSG